MLRIHPAQQFTFVEAQRDGVIGLARAWLPRRSLTGEHKRQPIQIADQAAINRLIKGEQARLVREELADGDPLLAVLRKLGPVPGDSFFVVEPAAGVGDRERHRGEALRGGVDEHHRVPLPRLARLLVPGTAPEVDDLLAVVIDTAGATNFTPSGKVLSERLAHCLEAATDVSLY